MTVESVKARYQIVIEGAPGAGKSTLIDQIIDKIYNQYNDRYVILQNGQPYEYKCNEAILNTAQGTDYLRCIYEPGFKEENLLNCLSIAVELLNNEIALFDAYPIEKGAKKALINITERNAASASAVFIISNFYNLRHNSDVKKKYYDSDYKVIESYAERMHKLCAFPTSKYNDNLMLYLVIDSNIALKRIKLRGRLYEAEYFTPEYMELLVSLYDRFTSPINTGQFDVPSYTHVNTCQFNVPSYTHLYKKCHLEKISSFYSDEVYEQSMKVVTNFIDNINVPSTFEGMLSLLWQRWLSQWLQKLGKVVLSLQRYMSSML